MSVDKREIDRNDIEYLAATLDVLEQYMPMDSAISEEFEDELKISRASAFRLNGMGLRIEVEKFLDKEGNVTGRSYAIAVSSAVCLNGESLISTDSCYVNLLSDNEAEWRVGYITKHRVQNGLGTPTVLPSDYIREEEEFYSGGPTEDEIEERRYDQEAERFFAGSIMNPDRRFSKYRLERLLPLLYLIGPDHVAHEQRSEQS